MHMFSTYYWMQFEIVMPSNFSEYALPNTLETTIKIFVSFYDLEISIMIFNKKNETCIDLQTYVYNYIIYVIFKH